MDGRFHGSGRVLWLGASLAVIASAVLVMRFVVPHRANLNANEPGAAVTPPAASPIPDLSVTSPLNQAGGGAVGTDAYEVYSGLYSEAQPEALAFAADSVTDLPQVDGGCLKPATADEREMADAFVAANKQSHRWERRFTIAAGYRLLSGAEASAAESCIQHRDVPGCGGYSGVLHVRYLGVPGFNRVHTRALVSVLKRCGGECGSGGVFVAEKVGGSWKRAAGTEFVSGCSWMY